jgi:ergothioneine biosynthesis protein EgtB
MKTCFANYSESTTAYAIFELFKKTRQYSETLIKNLNAEDCQLQSMSDASPAKWHLAHTSWFFEIFLLVPYLQAYKDFNPQFQVLFNSYYNGIGEQFTRSLRGLLARPSLQEVLSYRHHVDNYVEELCFRYSEIPPQLIEILMLGIHHEKQHQELLLMDIKHAFWVNPMRPIYSLTPENTDRYKTTSPLEWIDFETCIFEMGAKDTGFSFDNERPRHNQLIQSFKLASRLVTNKEYLTFIDDQGYEKPQYWLSDGWSTVKQNHLNAPLYWAKKNNCWYEFTLAGLKPLDLDGPVCHVNYYEASAFAAWTHKRLPTEAEWECASQSENIIGNPAELTHLHPQAVQGEGLVQMTSEVWQWTCSAYMPYQGFKPFADTAGEYNGKFMVNQIVLRGGSCLTPSQHLRSSYRNFYYPHQSWMMSGIRLAEDTHECSY